MSLAPVAIHEAGHALVACALGIGVRTVSVEPAPDSLGRIAFCPLPGAVVAGIFDRPDDFPETAVKLALMDVAVRVAGRLAEALAGYDASEPWRERCDVDWEERRAVDLCRAVGAPAVWAHSIRVGVMDGVEPWLRLHSNALAAVADALLRHRTLDGEQVAAVLAGYDLGCGPDLTRVIGLSRYLFARYRRREQVVA